MDTTLSNITRELQTAIGRLPSIIATEAVNFSKERFVSQNWIDDSTHPWKRRTTSGWGSLSSRRGRVRSGRAILVDSGRLKRGIRKISVSSSTIVIGTDVPYARAHNDGFRGPVKQHVKSYQRAVTKKGVIKVRENKNSTRIKIGRVQAGETTVKAHDRTIHQTLPRRRFMGASPALVQRLNRVVTAELNRAIHKFTR
jgi:phage gpG-like protein